LKKCMNMNIFQKIREVKLPFLAVIGTLVFGGIVAPASAATPTATGFSTTPTSTGVSIYFSTSGGSIGSGCKIVVRESGDPAPTSSDVVNATSAVAPDVAYQVRSLSLNPEIVTISGLLASTAYDYYAVCYESGLNNPTATPYSGAFTTSAAPQAPALSGPPNTLTISSTSTQITYSPNAVGYCKAVARLSTEAAPTASQIMSATSVSPNLSVSQGPVSSGVAANFTFSGLTQGNSYTAYFACQDMNATVTSNVYTHGFTQQAGGGGGSSLAACSTVNNLSQVRFSRSTLTPTDTYTIYPGAGNEIDCGINAANAGTRIEIDGQLARAPFFSPNVTFNYFNSPRAYSSITANNTNNVPIVDGSVYTLKYYVGLSGLPTASDTPVRVVSLVLYPSGNAPSSAPTTAAVQRPLPQINFAANPVNGVSARPTADTRKGTLTIEGSNLSDLTSITIGGKAATFTVKDGKLDIKLPAGVTGFPEVVMTNASGSITMQNAIEIYAPTVQKLTKFVGERLTLAGMETLENLYINNKTATALEATVVVAPDATEAEIAKAVKAATKAVTYIDKVGKRIVRTAITVSKTGEAGAKPSIEMSFTK
jgi:hypothetical protein